MNNRRILPIVLFLLAMVLGGAFVLYTDLGQKFIPDQLSTQATAQQEAIQEVALAPDVTVYDAQGNEVRLSDYFGKPIVLNFWASWCGPCQREMPGFQEKYQALGDQVHFLMVNDTTSNRETQEKAQAFLAETGYTFPVVYDTTGEAAMTYGAYSLPMTFFIDADGRVVAQATGAIDVETLQRGIDMIL